MDYAQELNKIKDWAKNLIIIQYRSSKKNRALIDLLVDLIFANNLAVKIRDLCLNVDKSEGAQLDIVGAWVGVDRYYDGIELWKKKYFSLPNYTSIRNSDYNQFQGGFSTYQNFGTLIGAFLTYKKWQDTKTKLNEMGDDYYREIIKLKIIKNSINHTCKNIDEAIWQWSNGQVYTTWETMKLTYNYNKEFSNIFKLAIYKNVLPAPSGCEIEVKEI